MEDKYFDEKLKFILEDSPRIEPDALAMNDMKMKLNSLQRSKRNRYFLPLLFTIFLLPSVFGGLFLFKKQQKLNSEFTEYKKKYNDGIITKLDTIINKHIIHHYDTIYQTVYRDNDGKYEKIFQREIEKFKLQSKQAIASYLNLDRKPYLTSFYKNDYLEESKFNWNYVPNKNELANIFNTTDSANKTRVFVIDKLSPIALSSVNGFINDVDIESVNSYYKYEIDPDQKIKLQDKIKPKSFSMGIYTLPFMRILNKYETEAFALGVKGELEFNNMFIIGLGGEYHELKYEVKDSEQFGDFPPSTPNSPDDFITEVKVRLINYQFPFSVSKKFLPRSKWQPRVDVGIVGYLSSRQSINYGFDGPSPTYSITSRLSESKFTFDNIRFGGGVTYSNGKRLEFQTGIIYQHGLNFNTSEFFQNQNIGLNLGLNYKL